MQIAQQCNNGTQVERSGTHGAGATGVYLYCFTRPDAARDFPSTGMDGCQQVAAIEVKEVAAVFSRVDLEEFNGDVSPANLQDPAWIVPRACRHEEVIERIMTHSPVLPVRFGAVFSSQQNLERLLAKNAQEISWFLDRMSDKEEWAVKGFVDGAKARAWLLSSDPELSRKRKGMARSPGSRYLQEKRLHNEADKRVKPWCRSVSQRVGEELTGRALRAHSLRLQPRNVSGRDAEMIFNCAFLLSRDSVTDFRARVESVQADYGEQGILFEPSGPWPPYNFCPAIEEAP